MESSLDYLGFVYDGNKVSIRQRSIEKFYRKMKKFIKKSMQKKKTYNSKNRNTRMKKIPHTDIIYGVFSDRGFKPVKGRKRTNFIEYVKRSQHKFDQISPDTENVMLEQIKNRKKKLEKLLGNRVYVRMTDN